ncbi:hypothetical protein FRB90_008799 [Tulasnella sp. 427]|nr:hypothetical protein FRB90_008799 [Tulasnella sp. 427]
MPRTPLSQRLGSLFSSRAPSPAVSEAASASRTSFSNVNQANKSAATQSTPFAQVVQVFNAFRGVEESPPKVVSRLENEAHTANPLPSRRGRPGSSSFDEATRDALREAISDSPFDYNRRPMAELPEPPQAFLPATNPMPTFHSIQTGQALKHPILLDNLGRSTFPSLALTDTHLQPRISPTPAPIPSSSSFPYLGRSGSPTRSSVDALRSLRDRDEALQGLQSAHIHTTALHPPVRGSTLESFTPTLPTNWWWSNKSDVDHLLQEEDQAPTAQEEEAKIRQKYRTPQNPIVFCHGLLGFDTVTLGASFVPLQISHWRGIKEVLEANGAEVLITRVPATSSPADRAAVLARIITERYKGRSVHLVGHSMVTTFIALTSQTDS